MPRCFYPFFSGLLLTFLLSSCGFQLRLNNQTLPFHALSLETNAPYSSFTKELKQTLETLGVTLEPTSSPSIKLQILSQTLTRTNTSLNNTGQTTSYLLTYTVFFQLLDDTGPILLGPQWVRTTRNFSITSNQLGGDLNTQNNLEEDMQNDIIQQLIVRLASPVLHQQLCHRLLKQ